MPWNDKSGGGGPWGGGGNGGGPWGQGPRGPSGPQGGPPDLEDIIRRGQDRLKQALPGGGHASPALFGLIGLALVALWLFQAIYTVQPDELAVELRFGKPKQELSEPGLHFHWWPIETVEIRQHRREAHPGRRSCAATPPPASCCRATRTSST